MRCPSIAELPPPPVGKTGWPWSVECARLPETMADGSLWPRVSVVTPSFNQGQFLEETIRSVLLQGYPNLEYIIIDGASSDSSVEIIRRYEPWLTYWVSEQDRGQSHAINKGFARASGEILTWLNSDDCLLPKALVTVATSHREAPGAAAWVGGCYRVTPDGRILGTVMPRGLERENLVAWSVRGFFYQPSCFIAARDLQAAGPLDENLHFALDLDLWLRLAGIGTLVLVPAMLSAAKIHASAKTQAQRSKMHLDILITQLKHGYRSEAENFLALLLEKPSLAEHLRLWLNARWRGLGARLKRRTKPVYLQDVIEAKS